MKRTTVGRNTETSKCCPQVIPLDPYSGVCLLLPVFVHTDTLGGVNQEKKSVKGVQHLGNTVSIDVCELWLMPTDFPPGSSNGRV